MFCISSLLLFSPHPLYINSSAPLTVLLHPLPFIPTTPCSARLMISRSLRKPTPPFTYRVPFLSLLFSDPIYTTPCTRCHLLFSSSPSSPTPSITIPSHTSTHLHPPVYQPIPSLPSFDSLPPPLHINTPYSYTFLSTPLSSSPSVFYPTCPFLCFSSHPSVQSYQPHILIFPLLLHSLSPSLPFSLLPVIFPLPPTTFMSVFPTLLFLILLPYIRHYLLATNVHLIPPSCLTVTFL